MRVRPFRALIVVLALVLAAEVAAILSIDTHEDERRAAEARYQAALEAYERQKEGMK